MHEGGSFGSYASFRKNPGKAHSQGTQNPQYCVALGRADPFLLYFTHLGFVLGTGSPVTLAGLEPST